VEGSGGTRDIQFAVTLSSAVAHPVSVAWETASGTALAGQDFAWSSGTVTFPPGVTSRTVTVTIVGDGTPEPDESFRVVLGGTAGVVLGDASAEGRIVNDDASGGPVRRRLRRGL
jgi:chitinase